MTFARIPRTEWRNVYVIGLLSILDKLQFGYFFWSLWPYLRQIDPTVSASIIGISHAFMGLGEAISAPLLGWYSNRTNGVLEGLIFSYSISLFGNVLYLSAKVLPSFARIPVAVVSRFLVGAGTANRAICFSYTSSISTVDDRARVISIVNGGMAVGMAMGPGMQVVLNFMGSSSFDIFGLVIDVNNVNALLGIATNLLCILLVLAALEEKSPPEQSLVERSSNSNTSTVSSLDKLTIAICIFSRIDRLFINSNFKSVGFVYSEIIFDYSESEALRVNSNVALISSFLVVGVFFMCAFTSFTKKFSDRIVVITALCITLGYHVMTMHWPIFHGHLPHCEKLDNNTDRSLLSWCDTLYPISEYLFYGGYILLNGIVLPLFGNSVKITLTKLLGGGKQGKILGLTQSITCISKVVGALLLSFLFTNFGPRPNWILEMLFLVVLLCFWVRYYKRMMR